MKLFLFFTKVWFRIGDLCSRIKNFICNELDPKRRKAKKCIKKFKNIHQGERCFIIGNGPSLKKQDLSKLKNEKCFCCNNMVLTDFYDKILPDYYVLADPIYFNGEGGKKILCKLNDAKKASELFIPYSFFLKWENMKIESDNNSTINIYPYLEQGIFLPNTPFVCDMENGISRAYTVTQKAALIAAYMGFTEINLLGCDGTGIVENVARWSGNKEGSFHFYEEQISIKEKTTDALYKEIIEVFEGHKRICEGYKRLELMCDKKGIRLQNASEAGIVKYIPCKSLNNILEE